MILQAEEKLIREREAFEAELEKEYEDRYNERVEELEEEYDNKVYDIIGKLGIIYKKETDVYNQNIIKDKSLRIIDVKRAYRKLLCYQEERISSKAC